MALWDELCKTLRLVGIVLWKAYVYTTALICDLCVCLAEAFKLVWLCSHHNLKNERNETNLVWFREFFDLA